MQPEGCVGRFVVGCIGLMGIFFLILPGAVHADSRSDLPAGSKAVVISVLQEDLPAKGDRVDLLWQAKTMVRGYVLIQNILVVDSQKGAVKGGSESDAAAETTGSTITLALNDRNQRLITLTNNKGKYTTLPHLGMVADQRKLHIALLEPRSSSQELEDGEFVNVGWFATRFSQGVKVLAEGALVIGGPRPLQLLTTHKQKKAIEANKTLGEFQVENYSSTAGLFKVARDQNRVQVTDSQGGNLDLVFDKKGHLVNRRADQGETDNKSK